MKRSECSLFKFYDFGHKISNLLESNGEGGYVSKLCVLRMDHNQSSINNSAIFLVNSHQLIGLGSN